MKISMALALTVGKVPEEHSKQEGQQVQRS